MRHNALPETRFFFATAPLPCPYLPNRVERRVVTELFGRDAVKLHDQLSLAGFRRSHGIVYAPACPGCDACKAVRIVVPEFKMTKSMKRVASANADIKVTQARPVATDEQYALFSKYQEGRHADGDMARMDFLDYQALIEDTPIETFLVELRDDTGALIGICLTDKLSDGLSAVYSFFDPDQPKRSLGSQMILSLIDLAAGLNMPYVYLGFWISGCSKMAYKSRFQPLEVHSAQGWQRFDPEVHD